VGTAAAPVLPGEIIELEFIIWDSGDGTVDGLALFDDFRWATIEQPVGCDVDGDLWAAASCGGTDCDDSNASIHPGARPSFSTGSTTTVTAWWTRASMRR